MPLLSGEGNCRAEVWTGSHRFPLDHWKIIGFAEWTMETVDFSFYLNKSAVFVIQYVQYSVDMDSSYNIK